MVASDPAAGAQHLDGVVAGLAQGTGQSCSVGAGAFYADGREGTEAVEVCCQVVVALLVGGEGAGCDHGALGGEYRPGCECPGGCRLQRPVPEVGPGTLASCLCW